MGVQEFKITPLGAAIVESMPDHARRKKIERDFKVHRVCPVSEIFDAAAIKRWYGNDVTPIDKNGKEIEVAK